MGHPTVSETALVTTAPGSFSEEHWRKLAGQAGYNVQALARLPGVAVSVRTLERLFRRKFQAGPRLTLSRWRAEAARSLLQSGAARNKDVVRLLGYYDESHLVRDFHKFFHCTPQSVSPRRRHDHDPPPAQTAPASPRQRLKQT